MGLLDRFFRRKEVTDCLTALELIGPLFARDDPYASSDLVLKRVKELILSSDSQGAIVESIKNGSSPHEVVLYAIVKNSQAFLSSGQFHVYRGVLNGQGHGIKAVFGIALDELVKSGFTNSKDADEHRTELAEDIKQMG